MVYIVMAHVVMVYIAMACVDMAPMTLSKGKEGGAVPDLLLERHHVRGSLPHPHHLVVVVHRRRKVVRP